MASKRRLRRHVCSRKRALTKQEATQVVESLREEGIERYHCPWCQAWHVGHRAPPSSLVHS